MKSEFKEVNASVKDIPAYDEVKMFSSYRIETYSDYILELRIANSVNIKEAVGVYKITNDEIKSLYQGRLNEKSYKLAVQILKDAYYNSMYGLKVKNNSFERYRKIKAGDKLYRIWHDKLIEVTITEGYTENLGPQGTSSIDGSMAFTIMYANMNDIYFYTIEDAINFELHKYENEIASLNINVEEIQEKIHECENHILRLKILRAQN